MISEHRYSVTDGVYTWGEHSTMRKRVESPCRPPETNVTLRANYTQVQKSKAQRAPNIIAPKYGEQIVTEPKGEINSNTTI